MSQNNDLLQSYLLKLGLHPEVADIYTTLHAYGSQTISELARNSGIKRIQIYRLLDTLKASGLIEVETRYKRSLIHAAPISNVQLLIVRKEQELQELQQDFPKVVQKFTGTEMHSATTKVQFYEGMEGLKQMLWNQTKSNTENLSILRDNMQHKTNLAFFERWVHACNERGIHFRSIVSDYFFANPTGMVHEASQ